MKKKSITQKSYDEMLSENEEIFDLSRSDAVVETNVQLQSQNVSLDTIVTLHPSSTQGKKERAKRKNLILFCNIINNYQIKNSEKYSSINLTVRRLTMFCRCDNLIPGNDAENKNMLAYLTLINQSCILTKLQIYLEEIISNLLVNDGLETKTEEEKMLVETIVQFWTVILTPSTFVKHIQSLIRDSFHRFRPLTRLITYYSQTDQPTQTTLLHLLRLIRVLSRYSERNKQRIVQSPDSSSSIITILRNSKNELLNDKKQRIRHNGCSSHMVLEIIAELCNCIRNLCQYDDFRSTPEDNFSISSFHDHVLEFYQQGITSLLFPLLSMSTTVTLEIQLTISMLSACRVLAVNDNIIQSFIANGFLLQLHSLFQLGLQGRHELIISGCIGCIRNLCGNDEVKTTLCLGSSTYTSILSLIIEAMKFYPRNISIQEHSCGSLAAMALRKPMNSLCIIDHKGPEYIIVAMKIFPLKATIQRQGALAIRNLISRLDIAYKEIIIELGVEEILQTMSRNHACCVDEAYAASRELGLCDSINSYSSTGRKVEQFGKVKSQFRPTYI